MSFKLLWELGEIYTAPLNFFLILLGMSYSKFEYGVFYNWRVLLFALTLLFIHIAVNIFNNYMDFKNAKDEHYKSQTNIIGREGLSLKRVWNYFLFFLGLSVISGMVLTYYSDAYILLLGLLGYYVGLGYSYGKRPINSLPIAETVPALLSGFMIPMMSAYLTSYQSLGDKTGFLLQTFIAFLPMVFCMFSNLLANNTCDLEEDVKNGRKTLVYYIGKKSSLNLFKALLAGSFVVLIIAVGIKAAPFFLLTGLLLFPFVVKLIQPYFSKQDKQTTFPLVLKGMSLLMVGYPILFTIGAFL